MLQVSKMKKFSYMIQNLIIQYIYIYISKGAINGIITIITYPHFNNFNGNTRFKCYHKNYQYKYIYMGASMYLDTKNHV
jgi:hypothetical protein